MSEESNESRQTTARFDEYVDVIQRLWAAFNEGDFEKALSLAHPEVQMHDPAVIPTPRWHHGHAGAAEWTAQLGEVVEDLRIVPVDISPIDDDRVLVIARASGRLKGSGLALDALGPVSEDNTWAAVVTMREGKCWRMEMFDTKAEALEAVGLSE